MSNIDNLRLKGANAKTANVGVTGNDLLTIINYANEQGQIGTGDIKSDGSVPFTGQEDFQSGLKVDTITPSGTSLVSFAAMLGLKVYTTAQEALLVPTAGAVYYNSDLDAIRSYDGAAWNTVGGLSTTGSDAGATASPQVFEQGVEVGIDNGVNGELTIYNGDSTGSVLITSTKDKEIKLDNTGHDVEVGINGAGVNGVALNVTGTTKSSRVRSNFYNSSLADGTNQILLGDTSTRAQVYVDNPNSKVVIGDVETNNNHTIITVDDSAQTFEASAANGVGINVAAESGVDLKVNGSVKIGTSLSTKTQTISTETNIDNTMHTILLDGSTDNVIAILPSAASNSGLELFFVAIDIGNTCKIITLANGDYTFSAQYEALIIQSNGTNWYAISKFTP